MKIRIFLISLLLLLCSSLCSAQRSYINLIDANSLNYYASGIKWPSGTTLTEGTGRQYTIGFTSLPVGTSLTVPTIYGSTADDGDLTLHGTSSATKTTSYIVLQSDGGNVGIGTVDPNDVLDVEGGNIRCDGDIKILGDDIFATTNTLGAIWVGDGTNFNPVLLYGDGQVYSDGNIVLISAITRDSEWDTISEINAATTDADVIATNSTWTGGDLSGTGLAPSVTDDSHAHTTTTLSSIDISSDTNLDANLPVILSGDTLTHSTANGYVHLPVDGAATQMLQYTSAGTAKWISLSADATIADNGAVSVGDDSHAHTGSTLSSIDISSDTNLSGDTESVLTGDVLSVGSTITRDIEWDTEAEVQNAWGAVNILLATEINLSSELAALMDDESGTGYYALTDSPVFTTQINLSEGNLINGGNLSCDSISSDANTSINIDLGSDSGDDFTVDTDKLIIEGDTGNVGIGTTTPTQKLSVQVAGTSTDEPFLVMETTEATPGAKDYVASIGINDTATWPALRIWNHAIGEIFRIEKDSTIKQYDGTPTLKNVISSTGNSYITGGNVGIGTIAPASILEVSELGTAKTVTTLAELTNSANATDMDYTGVRLLFNNYYFGETPAKWDSAEIIAYSEGNATSTAATQDGALTFSTSLNGAMTEAMRVTSAGNVGIGTTVPQSKLDVEGGVAIGATYSGTSVAPTNGAIIEGNVGIGTVDPNYTLNVNGKVQVNDLTMAGGADDVLSVGGVLTTVASSKRYKKDITPIDNVLNELLQLIPVQFTWNENTASEGKQDIGLIAEDVAEVLPDVPGLITYEKDGSIRGINYSRLSILLLQGMKEQQEIINNFEKRLKMLEMIHTYQGEN